MENRSHVSHAERDEFLVYKVAVRDGPGEGGIEEGAGNKVAQPFLAGIGFLLGEGELEKLGLGRLLHGLKLLEMLVQGGEVNSGHPHWNWNPIP